MIKNFFLTGLIAVIIGFMGINLGGHVIVAISIITGFMGICFLILSGIFYIHML